MKTLVAGFTRKIISASLLKLLLLFTALTSASISYAANTLESVTYSTLPGNRLQIVLGMSEPSAQPLSFTIDNPDRKSVV